MNGFPIFLFESVRSKIAFGSQPQVRVHVNPVFLKRRPDLLHRVTLVSVSPKCSGIVVALSANRGLKVEGSAPRVAQKSGL